MNRSILTSLVLFTLACGSDDEVASDASAQDASPHDASDLADSSTDASALRDAVGTFGIELIEVVPATDQTDATPATTSIVGRVYERAAPSKIQWLRQAEEGECQLLKPRAPFCDPACTGGAVCEADDTCTPVPKALDLGTITLSGLNDDSGDHPLELTALAPSNTYQPRGSSPFVYPPFEEGAVVQLSTEGGAYEPFELSAPAIAPLELSATSPLPFDPEGTTTIRWAPPADSAASHIIVRVDISHHGGQKGELLCETDDDGELELPAALVQGLVDLGVAGYPTIQVVRESKTTLPQAPGIALAISSSITLELDIPGITSCSEPGQQDVCGEGELCQANKLCP
jgi:hypothetical protein